MEIFFNWLKSPAKWSRLRIIGNSKIVKSTILIPLIGYLLLFNDFLLGYFNLYFDIVGEKESSGTTKINWTTFWRIYCIYFGLCFLALGASIYNFWCPIIIKRYENEIDYASKESLYLPRSEICNIYGELNVLLEPRVIDIAEDKVINIDEKIKGLYSQIQPHAIRTIELYNDKDPEAPNREFLNANEINIVLNGWYLYLDSKNPFLRPTVFWLFVLGFILLLIPSAVTFIAVLKSFISHLIS